MSTTTWPDGNSLATWLGGTDALSADGVAMLPELVDDATAIILDRVDSEKLPTDPLECPRPVARAIVLEAARLLSRRDSAHGIVSFGELAVRLAKVDADIEHALQYWGLDPEP